MKTSILILFVFNLLAYSQIKKGYISVYSLANITALTLADDYQSPKYSPDGNKILFTKLNYKGLFMLDLKTKQIVNLNMLEGAGFDASWSENSKSIYFSHKIYNKKNKFKFTTQVNSIDILTGKITNHPNVCIYGSLNSMSRVKSDNDTIIYIDIKTFNVKASTLDNRKEWEITKDGQKGGVPYLLVLSPDRKKVLIHKSGKMLIYAIDGSGLISSLGRGEGGSWSSDGKQILFFISKDDGHEITGSDLYLTNFDGSQRWQLTDTPNVIEEWPDWSPDNKQIVFSDINKGIIYIADLLKK